MSAATLLANGLRIGQAIVRVLGDSAKTSEIHRVGELTGQPQFRRFLAELPHSPDGRRLLAERPELGVEHVDYDRLRRLPAASLGAAYARHLDVHGLTSDARSTETLLVGDPDVAYLMRRLRQTHDVWHALLGLGIEGHEEVLVHCFTYGQLRLPVSALIILFGSIKHFMLERRWAALRHATLEAYRAGRDAAPLLAVYWEDLWEQPLDSVRASYGVRPLAATPSARA
jgi:ubiquinone biosynthesis protein COQ4